MKEARAAVSHIEANFPISDLADIAWQQAEPIRVTTYWSGETAPLGRHFDARLLWSDTHIYARFDAEQREELIVNSAPDLTQKTDGLWERDVCEIFLAPHRARRTRYFEFEVAPTGEWLDLLIEIVGDVRRTDREFTSQMESAAKIGDGNVTMAMKVPFSTLCAKPKLGDVWLGNIFRCIGSGATRGYLSWQPTHTEKPAFHVPGAFSEIEFR
ncbi:MAG TPA: carbohydrate-binding family 9-like protein [Pyrinomonadaceae bacterium]|nr:carbohydrate-binding family 9-like protein [Pyrinomonadaceae bacterium]